MMELWPLQREAVKAFSNLPGALLWDDMGLGKTVTTLAEIAADDSDKPILVIAKEEAHTHWQAHVERMHLDPSRFTYSTWNGLLESYREVCEFCLGTGKNKVFENCYECNGRGRHIKYRTRGELVRRWRFVVADEGHKAKNRHAKQRKALKMITLRADRIRMLSGSFVVNGIDDLWSPLNILDNKEWSSYWRFYGRYVDYVQHNAGSCRVCGNQTWHQRDYREVRGSKNEDELMARISGYTLHRKKKGCMCNALPAPHDHLPELPDVLEPVRLKVTMHPKQQRAYREMVAAALAWIGQFEDEAIPAAVALVQLTRLRQFACSYAEVEAGTKVRLIEPSAKLDALMELTQETDEPLVVFTMFRQMLDLISERFTKQGITHFTLHGGTPKEDRNDWRRFQDGERRAFVATIPTGGESIELTRASTVIFTDRAWTNKDNDQARDRLWRSGQKNSVQPIYLEAVGTVDEVNIPQALEVKASILRKLIGGS